jgi:hypothetical protein
MWVRADIYIASGSLATTAMSFTVNCLAATTAILSITISLPVIITYFHKFASFHCQTLIFIYLPAATAIPFTALLYQSPVLKYLFLLVYQPPLVYHPPQISFCHWLTSRH